MKETHRNSSQESLDRMTGDDIQHCYDNGFLPTELFERKEEDGSLYKYVIVCRNSGIVAQADSLNYITNKVSEIRLEADVNSREYEYKVFTYHANTSGIYEVDHMIV